MALPQFMGIGAQKAGTTWLYTMLKNSEEIQFPFRKEIHFWDMKDVYSKGMDWYKSLFDEGRIGGDITPDYAVLPEKRVREIHKMNPDLRLIFILRNPIERAWSLSLMILKNQFNKDVERVPDRWFIRDFNSLPSMMRGDYLTTIRRWRRFFGDERLLLMRYEDIEADPVRFLERCSIHVGADPSFIKKISKDKLSTKVRSGGGHILRPQLFPELLRIYAPKIRALEKELGWDLSRWYEYTYGDFVEELEKAKGEKYASIYNRGDSKQK